MIESVISTPEVAKLAHGEVDDFYNLYMINKRLRHYGVENEAASQVNQLLLTKLKSDWLISFDPKTLQLTSQKEKGVTIHSLRLLEIISSHMGNAEVGSKATQVVKEALTSLIKLTGAPVGVLSRENQIFFIAPRNAQDPQKLDLVQANFHFLNSVMEAQKQLNLTDFKFKQENYSLLRNYFFQKAVGNSLGSTQTLYFALRASQLLKDYPFLERVGQEQSQVTFDSKHSTLSFRSIDVFGAPVKIAKVSKASLIDLDDPEGEAKEITSLVSLLEGGNALQVELKSEIADLQWTNYAIEYKLVTASGRVVKLVKTFSLRLEVFGDAAISFSQTKDWSPPKAYEVQEGFPVKFKAKNTNAFPIIHL
mmetsp:Transcript_17492/g.29447  ORF Transcript_17492/g.29447 Transcript_17492/m.29447 type:complete len:365 (+) Transcript_17492:442-1536(+)